jgi:hypothetical protein
VSESEIHRRLVSVYGQNVFSQVFFCDAISLKIAERHSVMIGQTDPRVEAG